MSNHTRADWQVEKPRHIQIIVSHLDNVVDIVRLQRKSSVLVVIGTKSGERSKRLSLVAVRRVGMNDLDLPSNQLLQFDIPNHPIVTI